MVVGAAVVLIGLAYGIFRSLFQNSKPTEQEQKQDNPHKCDDIKSLLEQKKQELKEMVQDWPKEKLAEVARNAALSLMNKNEGTAKLAEVAESIEEKYAKLEQAISVLQTRFDLCNLSLPEVGESLYYGTIIKNSLSDPAILDNLKILKTYQLADWNLVDVQVNEKQIEKLGKVLQEGPWYMHFWQEKKDDLLVAFKDKNFRIKYSDQNSWAPVVDHAVKKGIPIEQLDFKKRDLSDSK